MEEKIENKKIIARIENLARQRKELLSLPSEEMLNSILNSQQSTALVHSFSEEDFYLLIHNIHSSLSCPTPFFAQKYNRILFLCLNSINFLEYFI